MATIIIIIITIDEIHLHPSTEAIQKVEELLIMKVRFPVVQSHPVIRIIQLVALLPIIIAVKADAMVMKVEMNQIPLEDAIDVDVNVAVKLISLWLTRNNNGRRSKDAKWKLKNLVCNLWEHPVDRL